MPRSRSQRSPRPERHRSDAQVAHRLEAIEQLRQRGAFDIPSSLPIAERHDDLIAAIRDHQVVIVA